MDYLAENVLAFVALAAMEIVLGIDNVVFISVLTGRLPEHQQAVARRLGLGAALLMRILLLLSLQWILGLENELFRFSRLGVPAEWLPKAAVDQVTARDVILFAGGLFLIGKSVHEIHKKLEGAEHQRKPGDHATLPATLAQIALLDVVFSLDSVITAVGMANQVPVMIAAIVAAVLVMLAFAGFVHRFVERHPTIKMLALSFLILIGVMLVAEGIGTHIEKGYIYFAMAFALAVEGLNIRVRAATRSPG